MAGDERWCVVTGGRGFAARHLVLMLIRHDVFRVRIADLGPTVDLEPSESNGLLAEALNSGRAEYISIDLRRKDQVVQGQLSSLILLVFGGYSSKLCIDGENVRALYSICSMSRC